LQGLLNKVKPEEMKYDVVSGVTGGALNAAILAGTP
jgi:hypothetical protein